jgi:chemotaxis protein methyltransferase CheR
MSLAKDPISQLGQLAQELTGVQMSEKHREMIKSRLQKRLTELSLPSLDAYLAYFHANRTSETPKFIGLLTTHHTYFFREFSHFEFMLQKSLPALLPILQKRSDRTLRIWSAACSRGQEVYSLAMFLDLHLKKLDPNLKYEILGTDIDPESVEIAKNGVYQFSELKEVPLSLMGSHWVRGTGAIASFAKAKASLRSNCRFQPMNLLKIDNDIQKAKKFDIIFCRNVFIYFNQEQIRSISQELLKCLDPAGYFFIGISESLMQLGLPVQSFGPSVYQYKTAATKVEAVLPGRQANPIPARAPAVVLPPPLIRVVCVDDSPVILTLLKQVLSRDHGFDIVGTAANGLEAAERIRDLKPDAVTLDIHMPLATGIEYLEKNFKTGHAPVVMVTSVTRENSDLAGRALSLGASDYVEKPALSNLAERGDEIRTKVRCAFMAGQMAAPVKLGLDQSFQKQSVVANLDEKLRIVAIALSHRPQLKKLFAELTGAQPPCLIFVDGAKDALEALTPILNKECGVKIQYAEVLPSALKPGEVWLMDFSTHAQAAAKTLAPNKKISILVYGEVSKGSAEKLAAFPGAQLLLADLGRGRGAEALMEIASDVVLPTSFAYLSNEYFANTLNQVDQRKKAA